MKWSDVGKKYRAKKKSSKFSTKPVPPEFAKLHLSSLVKSKGSPSWAISCPFHADGKSPSCHVVTEPGNKFNVGFFHCFGCGVSGFWEELATKANLPLFDSFKDVKGTRFSPLKVDKQETEENDLKVDLDTLKKWPKKKFWRTFSGVLLRKYGARYNPASSTYPLVWLCRPKKKKKVLGTIRSRVKPDPTDEWPSYLYSSGAWIAKYLWPQHKIGPTKKIVLVEGKRDALALLREGIPALAILGTSTGAGQTRINTLHRLGVEKILTFTDNDIAGKKAVKGYDKKGKDGKVIEHIPGLKELLSKEFEVKVYATWKKHPKKVLGKRDPHKLFKSKKFVKKFKKIFEAM